MKPVSDLRAGDYIFVGGWHDFVSDPCFVPITKIVWNGRSRTEKRIECYTQQLVLNADTMVLSA